MITPSSAKTAVASNCRLRANMSGATLPPSTARRAPRTRSVAGAPVASLLAPLLAALVASRGGLAYAAAMVDPLPTAGDAAPDVSLVVVSWNTVDLLRDCLRSVAASRGVTAECIVVDNGSQD